MFNTTERKLNLLGSQGHVLGFSTDTAEIFFFFPPNSFVLSVTTVHFTKISARPSASDRCVGAFYCSLEERKTPHNALPLHHHLAPGPFSRLFTLENIRLMQRKNLNFLSEAMFVRR